jgi:hypothetical protein
MALGCTRSPEHPAFQAWVQLCSKTVEPDLIEVVQEVRKGNAQSSVYRLYGVGPAGAPVIAKRSVAQSTHIERTIYDEILKYLPISSLTLYGCVDEPESEYSWLFLEYADGERFVNSTEEHCRLAARWLGEMHVSAARLPASAFLPDRGPEHYLAHLRFTQEIIQKHLHHEALKPQEFQVVEAILSQGRFLEAQWDRIEELCYRFPRTLVHCDFAKYNMRVRATPRGTDLVAFDWEMAGYGIPAPDIAEPSGRGVPRRRVNGDLPDYELGDYWSVVRNSWSDLKLNAIIQLAEIGAVFRSLAAISWESESIGRGWWPIKELHGYQADLAVALKHLRLGR